MGQLRLGVNCINTLSSNLTYQTLGMRNDYQMVFYICVECSNFALGNKRWLQGYRHLAIT